MASWPVVHANQGQPSNGRPSAPLSTSYGLSGQMQPGAFYQTTPLSTGNSDTRANFQTPLGYPSSQQFFSSAIAAAPGTGRDGVYPYDPLQNAEIRLVQLLPMRMSTIKCKLYRASLLNLPPYKAVSYTWGEPGDQTTIEVDGYTVRVGRNLQGALRSLRPLEGTQLIWIDGICIDQSNSLERAQQVRFMPFIYANAQEVMIWLGEDENHSDRALNVLLGLSRPDLTEASLTAMLGFSIQSPALEAMLHLFQRPYWQRLWVVQEIFHARRTMVCCGSSWLPWQAYLSATEGFSRLFDAGYKIQDHTGKQAFDMDTNRPVSDILRHGGPASVILRRDAIAPRDNEVVHVLRTGRTKLCADPRDKVFGFLGVLPPDVRENIRIDYTRPVKQVFTDAVDYVLATTRRLDVICESIRYPSYSDQFSLPWWVPDWTQDPKVVSLNRLSNFNFAASGTSNAEYSINELRTKLEVTAIFIGKVSHHGMPVGTLKVFETVLMAFLQWRGMLCSVLDIESSEPESEVACEVFCQTLSLGMPLQGVDTRAPKSMCYHAVAHTIQNHAPGIHMDRKLRKHAETVFPDQTQPDWQRLLVEQYQTCLMGRCLCITADGMIGLGSGLLHTGDVVIVPLGCSTPIVIRPTETAGEFRFVGDIFVDGAMQGQAFAEVQAGIRGTDKYTLL